MWLPTSLPSFLWLTGELLITVGRAKLENAQSHVLLSSPHANLKQNPTILINRLKGMALVLLLLLSATATSAVIHPILRSQRVGSGRGSGDDDNCVYTIYIRTGGIWKGGTDSKISVVLAGSNGLGVLIADLEDWGGLMGDGHNYFERGNLDIFSGRGSCLSSPPCWMNLTSDGSGDHHGWYCNYVEVTATGPHLGCFQRQFTVEQWLATDASPYQLYAARDYCSPDEGGVSGGKMLRFAVGGQRERAERD